MVNQLSGEVCGITVNIIDLSSCNDAAEINGNSYGTAAAWGMWWLGKADMTSSSWGSFPSFSVRALCLSTR